MARGWRLNPPPDWPPLPDGFRPGPDWSPDPAWGPAPPGWTLWQREPRTAWLLRHKTVTGVAGGALVLAAAALAAPAATLLVTPDAANVPAAAGSATPSSAGHEPRLDPSVRRPARESASRSRDLAAGETAPTGTPGEEQPSGRFQVNGAGLTPHERRPAEARSPSGSGGFGAESEPPGEEGRDPRCGRHAPQDPAVPTITPAPAPTGEPEREGEASGVDVADETADPSREGCDETPEPTGTSKPGTGEPGDGEPPAEPWWPEAAGRSPGGSAALPTEPAR